MELGIYSFAEKSLALGPTGESFAQRLGDLLEEIELADQVGLDVYGVGEHHRPDFAVSAPAVVLGAAAVRTKHIRLTSAVSVISSDDPVRVFEEFATVDALSGGRAEIMVGRGSFIESFPLFGHDLNDYDQLFSEKLDLLLRLRASEKVTLVRRQAPSAIAGSGRLSSAAPESAAGVDRRRGHAGVGSASRQLGATAGVGYHRRGPQTVRSVGGSISRCGNSRRT